MADLTPHEEWTRESIEECWNDGEFDWDEYQRLCDIADEWFDD